MKLEEPDVKVGSRTALGDAHAESLDGTKCEVASTQSKVRCATKSSSRSRTRRLWPERTSADCLTPCARQVDLDWLLSASAGSSIDN